MMSRRFLCARIVLAVVLTSTVLRAQNPDYVLSLSSNSSPPGGSTSISAFLDNNGSDMQGWTYGVCSDSTAVQPTSIDPADSGTVNGGGPPGFLTQQIFSGGWSQGVVVSLLGINTLPAGTIGFELAIVDYDLLPSVPAGFQPLDYCDTLGNPPVIIVVVVAGISIAPTTISGSIEVVPSEPVFIRGDANDDGGVNVGDVIWELNELFIGGSQQTLCTLADDANGDGIPNIGDPIYLLGFLFQNGPPPVAPFPNCGVIPGTTVADCEEAASCP